MARSPNATARPEFQETRQQEAGPNEPLFSGSRDVVDSDGTFYFNLPKDTLVALWGIDGEDELDFEVYEDRYVVYRRGEK